MNSFCVKLIIINSRILIYCFFFSFLAVYLLYAKLEEEHGLARHAMAVYEKATKAVLPEQRFEVKFRLLFHV